MRLEIAQYSVSPRNWLPVYLTVPEANSRLMTVNKT